MPNRLKETLAAGRVACGAQLRFGAPAIAELFSRAGYDWLLIDAEHAPQTPPGIQCQLQAAAGGGATTLVRVPTNDPDLIRLYLDMGAAGIVAPFINTADDARRGARACRYPPVGTRGYGPGRAAAFGLDKEYFRRANDEVLFIPIIESALGVENIDAILAIEGLDAAILGPVDLSIDLGVPLELEHPKLLAARQRLAEAGRRAGKPVGIGVPGDLADPANWRRIIDAGYRLLLAGGDEWYLADKCRQVAATAAQVREAYLVS
jgi:4-hydroxy-2-oxoheptanedioate aldolase